MNMAVPQSPSKAAKAFEDTTFSVQRSAFILSVVIFLAVAVRIALWRWGSSSGAVPPGDPEEYYRAAVHILHGGYHDTGKWLRPPSYPALLALLLPLAGMDVARALLLQAALMGLGSLAFYALGAQLFGQREGLLASALAGLFVPLAAFGGALYAEALFVLLLVLALAALDRALERGSWRWALVAGALIGAATLTRAVGLFFVPLAALLLALQRPATDEQRPAAVPWLALRGRWSASLALLLGAALVIGPWTARNYAVHQRLIAVDTNGGISMWWGVVRSPEEKVARDEVLFAVPNLADRQALALRWTAERLLDDPAEFVARARFKLASLYLLQTRSYAAGDVIAVSPAGEAVVQNAGELPLGLTLLADTQYVLLMLLGIAGVCFAPSWRQRLPALLWVAVASTLAAVTIGHPRLRLPIVAALIPFAAYALLRLPHAWRARGLMLRDRRAYAALAGCLVFLALIGSVRYVGWLRGEWYAFQARQALLGDNPDGARALLEQARAAQPDNALRVLALADLDLMREELIAADEGYRAALALEGRSLYARAMRAMLARELGQPEVAARELAAIDAYWRVRDDLYQWAWRNAHGPPPTRVVPGDPATFGHYAGFAPATPDLPTGRWTLGDGRVRLAGGCTDAVLLLRGPAGRTAMLEREGGETVTVALSGAEQEVRLTAGDGCAARTESVLRVRSITALLDLERAPWYAGVAVLEARTAER
ncbi:MAG: hypothetical protein RLZZ387_2366 [Chloroflexota bacterium]|jgi:4-amino-4-deoxy-L-arabinose transferase-like glycosyltransferase